jgi:two-component system phosphate regulon sensor histidine kinase PhoR
MYFSFNAIRVHYITTLTENLESLADASMPDIRDMLEHGRIKQLDAYAKVLQQKIKARVTVIDQTGKVLADSETDPEKMENHINRPEIAAVLHGEGNKGFGYSQRLSNTLHEKMLYLALPVMDDKGKVRWVLRLSLFLRQVNSLLSSLTGKIIQVSVIVLIFALIAAFISAKRLTDPIKMLGDAARKMAGKNFDVYVNIESKDELQDMADSFNNMARQIKKLFEEISMQKQELDTIISSINEGLVVINSKGTITKANDSFRKMLGSVDLKENIEGRYYWEAMLSTRFNELMEKSAREKKGITEQVDINNRLYLTGVNFLEKTGDRVAILYDITGIKEFEEMKKDFVANVSHELKTPLTAIKGFTETMEAETQDEDNKRYLGIIKRHSERLINIVDDLLTLSRLESSKKPVEFDQVNFEELISGTVRMFDSRMAAKGLAMKVYVEENLPEIRVDAFKIEQILINLIDNAIKYTEKGEVTVSASRYREGINIEVEDTGIGIPRQSIPRLFERFYTVDKSRSRKLGGTGLGLSIVKHIVQLHGGEINVTSEPGKGTKVTVYLPKIPS